MVIQDMASNSRRKNAKNNFKNCPAKVLKAVPTHCEKLLFSELKLGESYKDKAIIGKVDHIHPIGKRASGFIRKLLVTDALEEDGEDQMKLTVFLLDYWAEVSDGAHIGSFIIFENFLLEKSTHHKSNELPFQVLVRNDESHVLFIPPDLTEEVTFFQFAKEVSNSKPKASNQSKTVPVKKKFPSGEEAHGMQNRYEYTSLGDLTESAPKQTFNVYGIVEKCDLKVVQGRRTQVLDVIISDQSETGFVCTIFSAQDEVFPDIYPGDVIRIHRMQVYKFRSKLKGKCLCSRFILVFNKNNKGKPKTLAKSFTFSDEDLSRVKHLFEWYDRKTEPKLINELKRGDTANIVCQVIGVYCAKNKDVVTLKIWDGTKTNEFESSHLGLKEEIIDEKLFLIAKNYYVVLFVYGQHCTAAAELRPGQFIEIKDAMLYSPRSNPDDWKLCLNSGIKEGKGIQILSDDDERVKVLQRRLDAIWSEFPETGSQTDDLLNQNNSIFLNCDISALSSQAQNKEVADIEMLNTPLNPINEDSAIQQNRTVISVSEAAIKPGHSTQEFGAGFTQEFNETDIASQNDTPMAVEPDPVLNKTPLEFKRLLHEPDRDILSVTLSAGSGPITEVSKTVQAVSEVEMEYSHITSSQIAEILHHDVPSKFRILCAVMSIKPETTTLVKFIRLYCPVCLYMTEDALPQAITPFEERDGLFYFYCPECSAKEVNKENLPILAYTYFIWMHLHDGTQSSNFEVVLWGENAVLFFKGFTPEQALKNQTISNSILEMLWDICPNSRPVNENAFRPYPMLDCCILSYKVENTTIYQMCHTKLR